MVRQYKCDECGQPAMIHETVIENGGAIVSRHHCEEHGSKTLQGAVHIDDPAAQAQFATLVEWYNSLAASERSRIQLEYRLARRYI